MDVRAEFDRKKTTFGINFDVKDEQIKAAKGVLEKRNVLVLLPTGYGKTLCFVIPTMVKHELNPITLVISPLTALIDDQMHCLSTWNFSVAKLEPLADMDKDVVSRIKSGQFNFVFSSPETALKPLWKDVFMSKKWQDNAILLVLDEAHCVSEWGEDFRREFQELHELRSIFRTPVMALTATSTVEIKNDIIRHLHMQDADIVFKIPDRPNVFLNFVKSDSSELSDKLTFVINHLLQNGEDSKKNIIYCRSIDKVSDVFIHLKHVLGEKAYANGIRDSDNLIVEMFHGSTHEDSKKRILQDFKTPGGNLRCLVATVALGMGIQINDVDLVFHVGCPKSVLSYWQEAGRCARDGRPGFSYVLYDNFTASQKNTTKEIAKIVRNVENVCLRREILKTFDITQSFIREGELVLCTGCDDERCQCPSCLCCSVCEKKCPCFSRTNFNVETFLGMTDGPTDHFYV